MQESARFVIIPCRACRGTTLALANRSRPKLCARCRAPYDPASASFDRYPAPDWPPRMSEDELSSEV
jgi:hypothetical protein